MDQPAPRPASGTQPLAGRHALVTGASRGIGAAIARRLAGEGARLTLLARDQDALRRMADELGAQILVGDLAEGLPADLPDCDILVNNAGIAPTAPYHKAARADWDRALALNVTAPFLLSQRLGPGMAARGFGRIVNIASTAGLTPYRYVSGYVASKHALIGLTRALALELAEKGVTVNAVCPGFTDTDLVARSIETITARTGRSAAEAKAELVKGNPQGRLIDPAEVAATVAFLCRDEAASITGQALVVAGGEVMR